MTNKEEKVTGLNLLVVEDDPTLRVLLGKIFEKHGNTVEFADTAKTGEEIATQKQFDIIILDLRLPDGNGYDVCASIREKGVETPVLVLSAEHETDVKVKVLKVGADDYLTKPFEIDELLARLEVLNRRSKQGGERKIRCGELEIDLLERETIINGSEVQLTNSEFDLLVYFAKNRGRVLSQDELAKNVWENDFDTQTNYINVYISYLRKKMREHTDYPYIETIRKKGFKFDYETVNGTEKKSDKKQEKAEK